MKLRRVMLSKTEYESRLENTRTGQDIDKYRDMAGQAPYLVNLGIIYDEGQKGFLRNLEAGIFYNVKGQTLEYAGIADRPDIYSKPFHSLNLNANKRFGKEDRMRPGLRIENILNQKDESVFRSYEAADQYFTRLTPGTHFKVTFGYTF